MHDMAGDLPLLKQLAHGISQQFGPTCEVVIHDFASGPAHSIVHIENGHVTGRGVGESATNLSLERLNRPEGDLDRYSYRSQTEDGRLIKATSIYLRGDDGRVIGSVCINLDVTDLEMSRVAIESFVTTKSQSDEPEVYANDVDQLLAELLQRAVQLVGKPVAAMTREEKIRALQFLDAKGALTIKNSSDRIAAHFNISRFTLYSYLKENLGDSAAAGSPRPDESSVARSPAEDDGDA